MKLNLFLINGHEKQHSSSAGNAIEKSGKFESTQREIRTRRIGGDTILSTKGNCRRNPDSFATLGQIVFLSRYSRKRSKQASIKEPNLHRYRNKNQINQTTNRAAHRSAQQIAEHYRKHSVRKKKKNKERNRKTLIYLRMIYRGGLAICSDAGRCSNVRGWQIPRIHRDFGARVNLPDPLGTGGGTHGRGFHHRWPHPVCLVLAGPRNEIHARKRKAGRQARTHRGVSRGEQAKAHWPPLPPVLSICPFSLVVFPVSRWQNACQTEGEPRNCPWS